jgi:hypothetical protein
MRNMARHQASCVQSLPSTSHANMSISWTVASEIFPLDIRMLCVSLTTADTWLGSFIIARSTPYMISDLGYGAYFFFGAILICMGIWSFFCVPETKGKFPKHQHCRSKESPH